jgi:hypothetical protein
MNHHPLVVVACALALTGCMTEVTASSRSYLLASQSGAVSAHTPLDAAREVTRLFGVRGFALADQHALTTGGFELKLTKSDRAIAATKDEDANVGSRDIGSVFYVWVAPDATGSAIMMVGKPTLNGAEPCTKETPQLACQQVTADPTFASTFMSGKAEADVVHGVLSELALEGFATGSLPANAELEPAAPVASSDNPCVQQRDAAFAQAQAISDPAQRAKVLESAPVCAY